jgi:chromosome segregation protein
MSTEGAIAVVRGDLRSLEASDERDGREAGSVTERIEGLERRIAEHAEEAAGLNTEIRDLDSIVVEAQDRFHTVQSERKQLQEAWERAEAMYNEARVAGAAATARLAAVEEAAEGLADPESRSVVEAVDGYAGTIASLLDVPEDYAAAVDAVLGHLADALVLDDSASVEDTVAELKSKGLGGVSVVQLGRDAPAGAQTALPAGVTWLPDVLGQGADRSLSISLLGAAHVSESWKHGWQLSQSHPTSVFVTLEGDIFHGGTVRVAHPDGATPAMLENAQVEVERAETELARSRSLLTQSKRAFDGAREAERDTLETLESLEARLSGATDSIGRSERVVVESETELSRLTDRRASLRQAIDERAHQRAVLTERLANLEGEEAERQRAWEELTARRNEVARRREAARAEWQTLESDVTSMTSRRSMVENRIATIAELLDQEASSDESPERIERLQRVEVLARTALEILGTHLEDLRRRQAELREQAGEAGRRLDALTRTEREYRTEMDDAERRLSRVAVEEAELRVRFEATAERLRRDADATEAEAMAAPRPDIDSDDLAGVLRSREAELKRMGPINPLAAEEYAELSERHAFLSAQLDDLEASRSELRRIIEALDTEIHNQFLEAYTEIAAAYEENFGVLFPGGRGKLSLTEPDDPMTSGVEIGAQPVGKRVAKMSLLSGGERSLAALAFLFAVFKARPSPFYILDEVEAALDDANLRRFLRLLASFRDNAQLMIVTHQQQTMESGDVLYGVTMEPGGSSKVIAKAMSEVEQTV